MSVAPRAIGIDLGTTNSVVAVMRSGEPKVVLNRQGEPLTPSVVSLGRRSELLVGKHAKQQLSGNDTIFSIKRLMGLPFRHEHVQEALKNVSYKVGEGPGGEVLVYFKGRTYSPPEISAMILHRLRHDAEERLGEPVGRAVITVPAYFNESQVAATREAGRMAGFTVMRVLREPTAAALAFGIDREMPADGGAEDEAATVLVYDLGGGTFDISIMMMMQGQFHVLGIEGDKFLGGDNFDYRIMEHLYRTMPNGDALKNDPVARRKLKGKAEEAKKELSTVELVEILEAALAGVDIEAELSRADFDRLVEDYIQHTITLTHKAMQEANVTVEMIDHILLVGGSTLVPIVQEALRREFGDRKIKKNIDPMLCVAFGAALQTAMLDQIECPNPECHDEHGQQTRNPLEATECARCHTSLVGSETILCPVCYMPNDAHLRTCRKCQSSLHDGAGEDGAVKAPVTATPMRGEYWRCEHCDFPKNPMSAQVCQGCGKERDTGGVKCRKCGHLNAPGKETCANCGEIISGPLIDVVPENMGIELIDGRVAVLIPKNTAFPTPMPTPYSREFRTAEAGQRQLEVNVFQGSEDMAARNEYLGMMLLDLPPNLPADTKVIIALGLNADGTGIVTAQLRDFPQFRALARFLRVGTETPEEHRRRDELVQKAKTLLKKGEDLPEAGAFGALVQRIEDTRKELSNEAWVDFELEIAQFEEIVEEVVKVQHLLNAGKLVLAAAADYIPDADKMALEQRVKTLETTIARGQKTQLQQQAADLETFLNQKGGYVFIAQLEAIRRSGMVSAHLANRLGSSLNTLKSARSPQEAQRCVEDLNRLWDEVEKELGPGGGSRVSGMIKPKL